MRKGAMWLLGVLGLLLLPILLLINTLVSGRGRQDGVSYGVSQDGKWIVFSNSGANSLFLHQLANSQTSLLKSGRGERINPAFSPDGEQVVYAYRETLKEPWRLRIVSRQGGGDSELLPGTPYAQLEPAWSPDGQQIAFLGPALHRPYSMGGMTWNDYDLYVVDSSGGRPKRLTDVKAYQMSAPAWSPDSERVLVDYSDPYPAGTSTVLEVDASSGKEVRKVTVPEHTGSPFYIDSEVHVISDKEVPYNYELAKLDMASGEIGTLTDAKSYWMSPQYCPSDGLVYLLEDKQRSTRYTLIKVDLRHGGSSTEVLASEGFDR